VSAWTGNVMIVWGGSSEFNFNEVLDSGGRYDPVLDTWSPTPLTDAPSARGGAAAVWTGDELIVWNMGEGGRYSPARDSWTTTYFPNPPERRTSHRAVWTGSEMIVWGGFHELFGGENDFIKTRLEGYYFQPVYRETYIGCKAKFHFTAGAGSDTDEFFSPQTMGPVLTFQVTAGRMSNGKQCLAVRVYPGREDSIGVSLRSQGRDAVLKSLDAWQMENIYE